jgi:hypothetical protein
MDFSVNTATEAVELTPLPRISSGKVACCRLGTPGLTNYGGEPILGCNYRLYCSCEA